MVLSGILKPVRENVPETRKKNYSEELLDLQSSENIIKVIKSRRISWAEYVVRMDTIRNEYRILVRRCEGTRQFEIPRLRFLV
jgi:hypothetical protein